jgi:hypothetical protein
MDSDRRLYVSEDAAADFMCDTLTVYRTNGKDASRVRARIDKITKRYPFLTVRDPLDLLTPAPGLDCDPVPTSVCWTAEFRL